MQFRVESLLSDDQNGFAGDAALTSMLKEALRRVKASESEPPSFSELKSLN